MRVSGRGGGVRGVWTFLSEQRVQKRTDAPWTDGQYEWLLFFKPLVLEFREPFDEEFRGKAKAYSEKIKLHAGQIVQSIVALKPEEARNYIEALLKDKETELGVTRDYLGRSVVVAELLRNAIAEGKAIQPELEVAPQFLLLRENVESPWKDEPGRSYHYGSNVPNHKKITQGSQFLMDRRFPEGKKIIAKGRIANVVEESVAEGLPHSFRAQYATYEPLRPPRVFTSELADRLQSLPGYNPQHSIRIITRELYEELGQPPRAWIFQSNPTNYRLRDAVRELKEDTWLVTAHAEDIDAGQRVYIWESGPQGGIVAVVETVDRPSPRPESERGRRFMVDPTKFAGVRPRVLLRFLQVVDPILSRERILSHPELANMSIFHQPQGTNFPVSPEEAEVLENLLIPEPAITAKASTHAKRWADLTADDLNRISRGVLSGADRPLAIDESIVSRILQHLIVGDHVILIGPPGTGKTDLARRLLGACSRELLSKDKFREAVASYEWGRYEVVGGKSLDSSEESHFHLGCVSASIRDDQFLLIDEFNRADMNKAFGEMFMALDHRRITLHSDEQLNWITEDEKRAEAILIPEEWRMICTMNDYDKSLLSELSYGLLRRFAYVEIDTPKDKETEKSTVIQRVKRTLQETHKLDEEALKAAIDGEAGRVVDSFFDFIFRVRENRKIGTSTSIDVIHYLALGVAVLGRREPWVLLNEALVDYFLPQLDRLDLEVIRAVRAASQSVFVIDAQPVPQLQDFNARLDGMIKKLEELDKLFANR
jgi:MoxR-like ATPase